MAQPIIYTGQGASQALQGGGQSLQALGQFAQANQQLKRDELTKAVKDQDNILEMLKLDPVYSASMGAQEKIAEGIDTFTNAASKIVQDAYSKGGKLSTMDMNKIQQLKGVAMGKLNMYKAGQEQMLQAQKAIQSNPSRYYEPDFYKAVEDFQETGMWQNGLTAAYVDPALHFQKGEGFQKNSYSKLAYTNPVTGEKFYDKAEDVMVPDGNGGLRDANVDDYAAKGIMDYRSNPEVRLNINRKFDQLHNNDADIKKYAKIAQDNNLPSIYEAFAREEAIANSPRSTTSGSTIRSGDSDGYTITISGGTARNNNGKIIYQVAGVKDADLGDGKAIVFTTDNQESFPRTASDLDLGDDVVAKGDVVSMKIQRVKGDKAVVLIDKDQLFKVVEGSYDKNKMKYKVGDVKYDNEGKAIYTYHIPEEGVTRKVLPLNIISDRLEQIDKNFLKQKDAWEAGYINKTSDAGGTTDIGL